MCINNVLILNLLPACCLTTLHTCDICISINIMWVMVVQYIKMVHELELKSSKRIKCGHIIMLQVEAEEAKKCHCWLKNYLGYLKHIETKHNCDYSLFPK